MAFSAPDSSLLEFVAASQLLPAVRAALGFAIQTTGAAGALRFRAFRVLAQRFESESVHALLLALEWYCFAANITVSSPEKVPRGDDGATAVSTASFAEDMYGLKRTAVLKTARGRRAAAAAAVPLLVSPLACAALSVIPMYVEERLRERARAEQEREEQSDEIADGHSSGGRKYFWRRAVAVWDAVGVTYNFLYLVKVSASRTIENIRPEACIRVRFGGRRSCCHAYCDALTANTHTLLLRPSWVDCSFSSLAQASPYPSPAFHLLRARMVPATLNDMKQRREQSLAFRTQLQSRIDVIFQRLGLGGMPARVITSAFSAMGDYGRSVILCSLLGFQMLHWWYTTGEAAVKSSSKTRKSIPPPPPPPPMPPLISQRPGEEGPSDPLGPAMAAMGNVDEVIARANPVEHDPDEDKAFSVPLADDAALCSLCCSLRRNPCTITVSGYCFCYPCALGYVRRHGRCPVSLLECNEMHIRRLHL